MVGDQTVIALSNCRLHLCVIEMNQTINYLMRAAFQNVFIVPTTSMQYYSTQFTNTTTGFSGSWNIPINLLNVKGLVFCFRSPRNTASTDHILSQRCKLGLT